MPPDSLFVLNIENYFWLSEIEDSRFMHDGEISKTKRQGHFWPCLFIHPFAVEEILRERSRRSLLQ
jgi:hypothetical protein